jgi:hypothetical protein
MAIKRHAAARIAADQQLALVVAGWATDQGIVCKYMQGADDPGAAGVGRFDTRVGPPFRAPVIEAVARASTPAP